MIPEKMNVTCSDNFDVWPAIADSSAVVFALNDGRRTCLQLSSISIMQLSLLHAKGTAHS